MRPGSLTPMVDTFDVAIVGGGPAGCACALSASRAGLTVALFEAQLALSDKPCGEGLMPPGVDALRELGLDDVVLAGRPFDRLRYLVPGAEPLELALPRPGLAIDRPRLTLGLETALRRAHGVTRFAARAEVEQLREGSATAGFRITAPAIDVRARVLVAADGLNGKSAAWLRAGNPATARRGERDPAARLGIRARYEARRPLDAVEIHFSRGIEVYLTPLPMGRINLVVLVSDLGSNPGGCEAILARALAVHPRAASRLAKRVTEPEARVLGYQAPACVAQQRTLLVGDAGGGIDPILGCGVTLALESGILAARAAREIVAGDDSGEPEARYLRQYRSRTHKRRVLAAFLLGLAKRPLLARGTVGVLRFTPGILGSLVSVAAGGSNTTPIRRAAG